MTKEDNEVNARIDELATTIRESHDEVLRLEAVEELIAIGEKADRALPVLVEALHNEQNYEVLYLLVNLIGNFGVKASKAVSGLVDLLENFHDDEEILPVIIESLSKIGKGAKNAQRPLKELIEDYHELNIRLYAIEALERIIGSDIVPLLNRLIADEGEDDLVRIQSVRTITKIGTKDVISSLKKHLRKVKSDDLRVNIEAALGELGVREAIPKLLAKLIESEREYERAVAAEAFGKIKAKEATPVLLETALEDADINVRIKAVISLGAISSKEATSILINILNNDRDKDLRIEAIDALAKIKGVEAVSTLEKIAEHDEMDDVRIRAIHTLAKIGSEKSSTILTAILFEDHNRTVRITAAKALGDIGSKEVIPDLIEFLQKEDEEESVLDVVKETLLRLGEKGHAAALIGIIRSSDEIDIREEATKIVVGLEPMQAIPELMQLMRDQNPLVRSLAAYMLGEIGKKLGFEDYEQVIQAFKSGAIERNITQQKLHLDFKQKQAELAKKRKEADAEQALQQERENNLRKIIKRYSEISLERMAKLLKFKETPDLEQWLIELPDELAFHVNKDVVVIPQILQSESTEAEEAIDLIIDSFKGISQPTCHFCGYPIANDFKRCPNCGEEVLRCEVCKLPISFGDDLGLCSLCETKGHLTHMQEWVKVQGKCPHCLRKLPVEGILPVIHDTKEQVR